MSTETKTKKISTPEQRLAAIQYVKKGCDEQFVLYDSHIYQKFGPGDILARMLQAGVIRPTAGQPKGFYVWKYENEDLAELLNILWDRSGRIQRLMLMQEAEEKAPQKVIDTKSVVARVEAAAAAIRKYDIQNVEVFLTDVMTGAVELKEIPT